jgi:hypothetical protein
MPSVVNVGSEPVPVAVAHGAVPLTSNQGEPEAEGKDEGVLLVELLPPVASKVVSESEVADVELMLLLLL